MYEKNNHAFLGTLYELWTRSTNENRMPGWIRYAVSEDLQEIIDQLKRTQRINPTSECVIVAVHRCTLADTKPLTPPTGRPSKKDVDQVH